MESANQSAPHRLPDKQDEPPVKLLYIRSDEDTHDVLEAGLATIVGRYAPHV
jgi:hypothetical protein